MPCNHNEGAHHDCAHVERRNALIPIAERIATIRAGTPKTPAQRDAWSAAFLAAMDELWEFIEGRAGYPLEAALYNYRVPLRRTVDVGEA
jgi:hypothetical protein